MVPCFTKCYLLKWDHPPFYTSPLPCFLSPNPAQGPGAPSVGHSPGSRVTQLPVQSLPSWPAVFKSCEETPRPSRVGLIPSVVPLLSCPLTMAMSSLSGPPGRGFSHLPSASGGLVVMGSGLPGGGLPHLLIPSLPLLKVLMGLAHLPLTLPTSRYVSGGGGGGSLSVHLLRVRALWGWVLTPFEVPTLLSFWGLIRSGYTMLSCTFPTGICWMNYKWSQTIPFLQ